MSQPFVRNDQFELGVIAAAIPVLDQLRAVLWPTDAPALSDELLAIRRGGTQVIEALRAQLGMLRDAIDPPPPVIPGLPPGSMLLSPEQAAAYQAFVAAQQAAGSEASGS